MRQSIFLLVLFSTGLLATGRSVNRHKALVELVEDGNTYRGKVHINGVPHAVNLRRPDASAFARNFRLTEAIADPLDDMSIRDITPSNGVRALDERIFVDEDAHAVFRLRNDSGGVQLHGHMKNMHISHDGEEHFAVIHEYPGDHYFKDYLETNMTLAYEKAGVRGGITKANPELHLTVDYKLWTDLGESDENVLDHLAIMVHGANRRFKTISDPQVVFKIVDSLIIKDRSKQPFIESSKTSIRGEYSQAETVPKYGAFINKLNDGKDMKYDIAALISGETYFDSSGLAYKGGPCEFAEPDIVGVKTKVYLGVLLASEEKAIFVGVFTLAHELAHSLGAPHDGNVDGTDEGSGDCPHEDGFIMSTKWNDKNILTFSPCSVRLMKQYIEQTPCVSTNQSETARPESTKDPGSIVSQDQQCSVMLPLGTRKSSEGAQCADGSAIYSRIHMNTPDKLCNQLICYCKATNEHFPLVNRVLDGTPCKKDGTAVCQEGKCVAL